MAVAQLQQQNIAAAAAYTEYTVKIPSGAVQPTIQLRPNGSTGSAVPANIFWYMAPSGSSSPGSAANLPSVYNTIPIANNRTISGKLGGQTIYFQCDQANQLLELDYFSDI